MSQLAAQGPHGPAHAGEARWRIEPATITAPAAWAGAVPGLLLVLGAAAIIVTAIYGLTGANLKHALAAYHVGVLYTLSLAIGSLALVMIMHQFNAGWSVTVRRLLENAASLFPVCLVLLLPVLVIELANHGVLFERWMEPGLRDHASPLYDPLIDHKSPYLNTPFFLFRAALYFAVWIFLSWRLLAYSREQDRTGDRWLTARARRLSSIGLVLLALTTAFAGYDWAMSLDPHFYSTMWGVYIFAGSALAATALCVLTAAKLRYYGKLEGLVTDEHLHDLGKLMLAFTIFWAYISFSQYFLIWYSNIPEETSWYVLRKHHGWQNLAVALCVGHFALPFLFLLWRNSKRRILLIGAAAAWILFMHALDLVFIIRPEVYKPGLGQAGTPSVGFEPLLDVAGVLGPVLVFLGVYARRLAAAPLIPVNDPRLGEALEHRNYV